MKTILDVKNLSVSFANKEVLHGFSIAVSKGETVSLIGETGSGKSVLIKSILGINYGSDTKGSISFDGKDLTQLDDEQKRKLRRKSISYIPQDPGDALDPVYKISYQIKEIAGDVNVENIIKECGEESSVLELYPHQLSGGRKQRILIAMALAGNHLLVLADEPTTALDKPLKKRILNLLYRLKNKKGNSLLLVTHDFASLQGSDKIAVIYNGYLMEYGDCKVIENPLHPYTRLLRQAASYSKSDYKMSSTGNLPNGACPFFDRCGLSDRRCEKLPKLEELSGRLVRCYYAAKFVQGD